MHLSAWAEGTQSRAQTLASRIQRFSAFLHNSAISPLEWYQPVLRAALSAWPATQRVSVALDTSVLTPFVLIRTALVYRGRALPLTWRVLRHRSAKVSFAAYQPLLDQLAALFPTEQPLTLLADRGFAQEALLEYVRAHHYHIRLRLAGSTLVHLRSSWIVPLKALYPPAGHARFLQQVHLFGSAFGPLSLALATPLEAPDDPWGVASSEPADLTTLTDYRRRFEVEEGFKDDKAGGFQLQRSRLLDPDALERLLLCLALATLYLTSIGTSVVVAQKQHWVDPHGQRSLSYLQLGARWRRQQVQRGWQGFPAFQLDPAPDPLPLPTLHRDFITVSDQDDLTPAA